MPHQHLRARFSDSSSAEVGDAQPVRPEGAVVAGFQELEENAASTIVVAPIELRVDRVLSYLDSEMPTPGAKINRTLVLKFLTGS